MKVSDVMTRRVVTIAASARVAEAARQMLNHRISGLPVVDRKGSLIGMVSEGDLLRRSEVGTERHRPRWLEFLVGPGRLARDYVRSHGRKVGEVMTSDVATVAEGTPLDRVVEIMESRRIKRLPVLRAGKLVGIVSRANLLQALAGIGGEMPAAGADDKTIRRRFLAQLEKLPWAPRAAINVVVRKGVVHLWGTIFDARERDALKVAAENLPGVKAVEDHLVWVEPMSGTVLDLPSAAAKKERSKKKR
jgi:CBS domain-containing protein